MQKILLLVIVLTAGVYLQAQVVVTPQLPSMGLAIKPQLWNMSLINSSGTALMVQVQMVMTDVNTSQIVLTGSTPVFLLPTGAKAINAGNVAPITYTSGEGYSIDPGPNGLLPVGVYNICYTITKWSKNIAEPYGEECLTVEIEPISPPQLVQPADNDTVANTRPFFTWLPPAPFSSFSHLQYDWLLVEVQATQSAADAVQQNIPMLVQSNLSFTSLQYPLSMPELDTAKLYAWRVTAKNNSAPIANSEVWSFWVKTPQNDPQKPKGHGYYVKLRREPDAAYAITGSTIRFLYFQELSSPSVQIQLTDISDASRALVPLDSSVMAVKYGSNYLELNLSGRSGMISRHIYLLELVNEKQEHWYMKFEYREN